jgi:hypothetical protein
MRQVVLVSSVVSAVVSALMTALAFIVVLPAVAGAQGTSLQADRLTIVGADGRPRALAQVTAEDTGQIQVFRKDGSVAVGIRSGSGMPVDPANANLNVIYPAGTNAASLGILGTAGLRIRDQAGNVRIVAVLDEAGDPSIQLLDAAGNVIWNAP